MASVFGAVGRVATFDSLEPLFEPHLFLFTTGRAEIKIFFKFISQSNWWKARKYRKRGRGNPNKNTTSSTSPQIYSMRLEGRLLEWRFGGVVIATQLKRPKKSDHWVASRDMLNITSLWLQVGKVFGLEAYSSHSFIALLGGHKSGVAILL